MKTLGIVTFICLVLGVAYANQPKIIHVLFDDTDNSYVTPPEGSFASNNNTDCSESDSNKGHGNDCDGFDEDNPGNK